MKKYIAFLLCLIMIISLFSCNKNNTNEEETYHTNINTPSEIPSDNTKKENVADYSKILDMYRSIIEILPDYVDSKEAMDNYCTELGIVDEEEKELFVKLFGSTFDFKKSPPYKLSCGYAKKDLNGDGVDELVLLNNEYYIMAVFSYCDGNPVLLGNYWPRHACWIDGDGLLHLNGSGGADYSTNAVYKIADGGDKLELIVEFGTNGHEWIGEVAYTKYYKVVNGEKVDISEAECSQLFAQYGKYLGSVAGAAETQEHSGLEFISMYTESELAMEMYEVAIKGEISVFDDSLGETKLEDCRFPSNNLRLGECEILNKANLDMDGDGINEYVIQSEAKDHIVLHYHNGKVYSYCFDSSDFYNLNTDGSFYWRDSYESENWSRGLNQIEFDGSSLSIKEIYRIKHAHPFDIYNDLEFYVDGKQITSREFSDYHNSRTVVIFSPLDVSCEYPISSEKAYELASNHWGIESGMSEGASGTRIVHRIVILEKPNSDTLSYRICWQMEGYANHIPDTFYSLPPKSVIPHKELIVDAITGECREYINKKYYKIEELELTKVRYYIYDSNGNIVLSDETDRPLDISMLGDNIVDICIGMGTGISIHKYYDIENNRFSEEYSYVAASSGNLVAYIDTSMEKPLFNRVLVVRDIFDKNIFYKSFVLDFSPTVDDPIESATFTDGESELEVVYLSERPPVPLSITIPIRRASNEGEILSQSEFAMEMYAAALNCDIKVYDTDLGEFIYLKDCKKPYEQIPLDEIGSLSYAYTDMDSDFVNELVINCGDTLILRYYEGTGTVHLYSFMFRNLYYLNTDGSYAWNHTGSDFEYGEDKIVFDGAELNTVRLWRIVNDGEPDAEYYIGDKKVTQEELLKYFEDNPNTPIEYTPFEAPWQKAISLERALEIASEYWYEYYNIKAGDVDIETGFPYALLPKNSNNENYRIALAWLVEGSHYSTLEIIEIDAFTGEIITPTYESDGKG